MGKSKAPPPPDYAAAAVAQGAANVDAARVAGKLNNPDYFTSLGSRQVTYGVNGDPDRVAIHETLTPEGQKLFDQENRISSSYGDIAESGLGRLGQSFGTMFDASGLPAVDNSYLNQSNFSGARSPQLSQYQAANLPEIGQDVLSRDKVQEALMARLQPQLDRARQQREDNLLIQGQGRGGTAWNTAQDDLARGETDANLGAILGAGDEQQRLFNMALANRQNSQNENLQNYNATLQGQQGQFQNDMASQQQNLQGLQSLYGMQSGERQRSLQEALALRQLPLSEINALRTGSQPTLPQFQQYQGQSVGAAPVFQAAQNQYQAQLADVNAKNAQTAGLYQGLFGLGSAAITGGASAGGFSNLFR